MFLRVQRDKMTLSDTRHLLSIFLAVQRYRHTTPRLHLNATRHSDTENKRERKVRCLTRPPCLAAGRGGRVLVVASG